MKSNILTLFGLGKIKFSASLASLAALLLFLLVRELDLIGQGLSIAIYLMVFLASFIAISKNKKYAQKDPKEIVIDEFLGMYTCLMIASASLLTTNLLLFIAFRFFDIFKIPPFSFIDKKMKSEYAVILDDIVIGAAIGVAFLLIKFLIF